MLGGWWLLWVVDGGLVDAGCPSWCVCWLWSSSFGFDVVDREVYEFER